MKRHVGSAIAAIGLLALGAQAVHADALLADGDGVAPVAGNRLDFGTVCHGQPVTLPALVAVRATGHPNNLQVFENGTTVTLGASVLEGDGLAAETVNSVMVMAADWRSQPNGSQTEPVTFAITLMPGEVGRFTGRIQFRADGINRNGDAISRTDNLNVRARVEDCTAPAIAVPDLVFVEATSADGADADWALPTATDAVDGPVDVECSIDPPLTLPLGTTKVSCEAEDDAENQATASFDVQVADTTPPVLEDLPEDITVDPGGDDGAVVDWIEPVASDVVDGAVPVFCDPTPGSYFLPGIQTVACSAVDAAGNEATAEFMVEVLASVEAPGDQPGGPDDDWSEGQRSAEPLPDTAMARPNHVSSIGLLLFLLGGAWAAGGQHRARRRSDRREG
jgi:hypothetical protein